MLGGRGLRSRCAGFLLAPGKSWNRHQQQKHYPPLQHIFALQNTIHYCLLTPELVGDPSTPETPLLIRSCEFAGYYLPHGQYSQISLTRLSFFPRNGGEVCTTSSTPLRTRRRRQTVSWSEKTLPEVGPLRNHFDS